jgi:hypothetical protein
VIIKNRNSGGGVAAEFCLCGIQERASVRNSSNLLLN